MYLMQDIQTILDQERLTKRNVMFLDRKQSVTETVQHGNLNLNVKIMFLLDLQDEVVVVVVVVVDIVEMEKYKDQIVMMLLKSVIK